MITRLRASIMFGDIIFFVAQRKAGNSEPWLNSNTRYTSSGYLQELNTVQNNRWYHFEGHLSYNSMDKTHIWTDRRRASLCSRGLLIMWSSNEFGQSCRRYGPYTKPGLEVIKLEFILRLKIKLNDWLLVDTCPQAANHCALFWVWDCTQAL